MRNRAKCCLCKEIIESFHQNDYVSCKCGEISISGGSYKLECFSKNWDNFMRIGERDEEIKVKLQSETLEKEKHEELKKLTQEEKLEMLDQMIKFYEEMPPNALFSPTTQCDMKAVFIMMKQMLL